MWNPLIKTAMMGAQPLTCDLSQVASRPTLPFCPGDGTWFSIKKLELCLPSLSVVKNLEFPERTRGKSWVLPFLSQPPTPN